MRPREASTTGAVLTALLSVYSLFEPDLFAGPRAIGARTLQEDFGFCFVNLKLFQ